MTPFGVSPPAPVAFLRNADSLWFDPLPDYDLEAAGTSRGRPCKVAPEKVADLFDNGQPMANKALVSALRERFHVCKRTAQDTIAKALEGGFVLKDEEGRYAPAPA